MDAERDLDQQATLSGRLIGKTPGFGPGNARSNRAPRTKLAAVLARLKPAEFPNITDRLPEPFDL